MMKMNLLLMAMAVFQVGRSQAQPTTKISDQIRIHVTMVEENHQKPLGGMTLTVYAESGQPQVYSTDSLGKCPRLDLDLNRYYRIAMSGKNYLTKVIEIDGRGLPEEEKSPKGMDVELETKMVNKSELSVCQAAELEEIENAVFTRLRYDKKALKLAWDIQAVERIKNRIDDCRVE